MADSWAGLTAEERAERSRRVSETLRNHYVQHPETSIRISENLRTTLSSRSPEERVEWRKKISEGNKKTWRAKTPQEMARHNERLSESCRKSGWKVSEARKAYFAQLGEEERARISKRISDTLLEYYSSLTFAERAEKYGHDGSLFYLEHPEVADEIAEKVRKNWADMPLEGRNKRVRAIVLGSQRRPTEPELFLGMYLERNFPGEWLYNGDGKAGFVIGGRVPDFVNINGRKVVVEVFGEYWHKFGSEGDKIAHYSRYGYDCIVVWELDCYLREELDKIFKRFGGVKGVRAISNQNLSEPSDDVAKEVISPC